MNHKNLTVYKANKVIEAGYKLTLNEQRVVLACIAQVHSKEALLTTDEFELSAKDFATIFAVSDDNAYHALVDVAKTLFARYVVVDNPYPDRPRVKRLEMRWISSIEYLPDDGKISLCFSKKMLPFLSELKRTFTKYRLEHIGKMTCVYAIRLYELLVQWQSTGTREIQIDWLKKQFQIDDKYAAMKDFKKYVIDPAVKDINKHSNFQVRWEQRKTGRRVTHLTFTFTEKQPLTPEKPKRITKPKEKMIYGVPVSEIVKVAAIGESYEDTAGRINRKKAAKKTPAPITTPTPTDHIEKMGIKKPQATAPVVSPSFAAESEAHRISVINYFVSKHKAAYLAEFNSKGFVSINGISGAIIEADLKLAGLFD